MEANILFKNLKVSPPDASIFQIDELILAEQRAKLNQRLTNRGTVSLGTEED